MAQGTPSDTDPSGTTAASRSLYESVLDTVLTGVAITVPLVVTLYVLTIARDFVVDALAPVITLLRWLGLVGPFENLALIGLLIDIGVYEFVIGIFTELVALVALLGVILVAGLLGRHRYGARVIDVVDLTIASIPGIGTIYKSFRRMGDVMLDEGSENFKDVKLVQCLDEDMYLLGFETSDAPPTIETATSHEKMVSLFLPLAPNPVTGGFLTYVPEENVYDIDMTIQEGVRSILTSGIAADDGEQEMLTMGDLKEVTDWERLQNSVEDDKQ